MKNVITVIIKRQTIDLYLPVSHDDYIRANRYKRRRRRLLQFIIRIIATTSVIIIMVTVS